jgi:hypothetical protein
MAVSAISAHIAGVRDFNKDGKSDILWHNDSGEVDIWEMNGTTVIGGGSLGNPGPSWDVMGLATTTMTADPTSSSRTAAGPWTSGR